MDISKKQAPAREGITVQAPGRINIIGEHTDYNDGFVLPAAIDKKTTVVMRRNGTSSTANLTDSKQQTSFSFDLRNFAPHEKGWHNYVMGVVHELQVLGAEIGGFDAGFRGDVPIGSGMSSSAALECSFAFALNELFQLGFDKWQLIKASQMAEHHFVGIKCGIMDQFASVMGKHDQVMLLDCRSLEFQYFPFEPGDYQLLLLNSNVSHSLASSEYNTRRSECEEGVAILKKEIPEITNLRDVGLGQLLACRAKLPEPVFRRCHHVVAENLRVLDATKSLLDSNFKKLGELMYQSHFSLQNDYEVSCPELDFLVTQTLEKAYIPGSRMMGGGFGGCTINIVEKQRVGEFVEQVSKSYRNQFGVDLTPIEVAIEDGAKILK
ncbi:MAG: galactokinase [Saprospiraceae bacterium]